MNRYFFLFFILIGLWGAACRKTHHPPEAEAGHELVVASFVAEPNPVERGGTLILRWSVPGAANVQIWSLSFDTHRQSWNRNLTKPAMNGAAEGQVTVNVPLEQRQTLRFELEATDEAGATIQATTGDIEIVCYPHAFVEAEPMHGCPYPPQVSPAEFQSFEHGFMIWRGDTHQVFIVPDSIPPWVVVPTTGEAVAVGSPPAGFYAPGQRFAEVWTRDLSAYTRSVHETLGWAMAPSQPYSLTLQMNLGECRSIICNSISLSRPDDRPIYLVIPEALWPMPTVGPAWAFLSTNLPVISATEGTNEDTPISSAMQPTNVNTPVSTPPLAPAVILSFTADRTAVTTGDPVTFHWVTDGVERVTLVRFAVGDTMAQTWEDLPPTGSLELTMEGVERDQYLFELRAHNGGFAYDSFTTQAIMIRFPCTDTAFFPLNACPAEPAIDSPAVEQKFENGRMIWVQSTGSTYVFFDDHNYETFSDYWASDKPESDPDIVPPAEFYQPVGVLGQVWREAAGVREKLGWAIGLERSFTTAYQYGWLTCSGGCSGPAFYYYLQTTDPNCVFQVNDSPSWSRYCWNP